MLNVFGDNYGMRIAGRDFRRELKQRSRKSSTKVVFPELVLRVFSARPLGADDPDCIFINSCRIIM